MADNGSSGLRKAAILLCSLSQDIGSKLMSTLDPESLESLTLEIARLDRVDQGEQDAVIDEFYTLGLARQYMEQGGPDYARKLLKDSVSEEQASHILNTIEQSIRQTPFSFLVNADSENLLAFILDEHPQTIALILSHLSSQQATEILAGLPSEKQIDVVRRIANMEQTNPEVIREVESGLESRLAAVVSQKLEKAGGVDTVAEILNLSDRSTERSILESLEEEDPDLVEQIRRLMFVFEDILHVNDKGIQGVLKEVDNSELSLALKACSDELKEKIFTNMSERAALTIKEEMEYMGPVRLSDVEAAQQRIVDVVRRLEEAGELIVQGRGGEEEVVV